MHLLLDCPCGLLFECIGSHARLKRHMTLYTHYVQGYFQVKCRTLVLGKLFVERWNSVT
jgi:hypothetical protein